jgi:tetratricopeptide (TPR) repeat protein
MADSPERLPLDRDMDAAEPDIDAAEPDEQAEQASRGVRVPYWTTGVEPDTAVLVDRAAPLAPGEQEIFLVAVRVDDGGEGCALLTDRRVILLTPVSGGYSPMSFALNEVSAAYRLAAKPTPVIEIATAPDRAAAVSMPDDRDAAAPTPASARTRFAVRGPVVMKPGFRLWFKSGWWLANDPYVNRYRDFTWIAFEMVRDAVARATGTSGSGRATAAGRQPGSGVTDVARPSTDLTLVEARGLIAVRRDLEAIAMLEAAGARSCDNPPVTVAMAIALWNAGRAADAMELIAALRTRHPEDAETQTAYGWLAASSGVKVAASSLKDVPLIPKDADSARALAAVALGARNGLQLAAAATVIEESDGVLGAILSGHAALIEKDWNRAAAAYTRAIANDPYCLQAYHNRSVAYHRLRNRRQAIADGLAMVRLSGSIQARETITRALEGSLSEGQRWIAAAVVFAFLTAFGGIYVAPSIVAGVAVASAAVVVALLIREAVEIRRLEPAARKLYFWPPRQLKVGGDLLFGGMLGFWLARTAGYFLPIIGLGATTPDPMNQFMAGVLAAGMVALLWAGWAYWRRNRHLDWADMSVDLRAGRAVSADLG